MGYMGFHGVVQVGYEVNPVTRRSTMSQPNRRRKRHISDRCITIMSRGIYQPIGEQCRSLEAGITPDQLTCAGTTECSASLRWRRAPRQNSQDAVACRLAFHRQAPSVLGRCFKCRFRAAKSHHSTFRTDVPGAALHVSTTRPLWYRYEIWQGRAKESVMT